jgi:hypothetical protein
MGTAFQRTYRHFQNKDRSITAVKVLLGDKSFGPFKRLHRADHVGVKIRLCVFPIAAVVHVGLLQRDAAVVVLPHRSSHSTDAKLLSSTPRLLRHALRERRAVAGFLHVAGVS